MRDKGGEGHGMGGERSGKGSGREGEEGRDEEGWGGKTIEERCGGEG